MQTWLQRVHVRQKTACQSACCAATPAQRSPPFVPTTHPGPPPLCMQPLTAGLTHHTSPTLLPSIMSTSFCGGLVDTRSAVWRWRGRSPRSASVRRCTHPGGPSRTTPPPSACLLVSHFLPALHSQHSRPVSSRARSLSFPRRWTAEELLPAPALPVMFPLQPPLLRLQSNH